MFINGQKFMVTNNFQSYINEFYYTIIMTFITLFTKSLAQQ